MKAIRRAVRPLIKRSFKRVAQICGFALPSPRPASRILTYHSVGAVDHDMNVTPGMFRDQLAWLADHYPVISLREAAEGKPGIALTFDDGYHDNLYNAAPMLAERQFPATVFLITGKMGGLADESLDPDTSRLMTWKEAREIETFGVQLGGHTMTHPHLARQDEEEQRWEIGECLKQLEENLGHRPECFAYPYGTSADFNAISMRIVREFGCSYACSNRYGYNANGVDRWALRRIWIDSTDTLGTYAAKIEGRLDLLAVLDSPAGMTARRILNRIA